jgi:D-lyxose ketol-isomerase
LRVVKRSEINNACREAAACFARHGWALPPAPRWDITDFGLGDFARAGLILINLAEEPEYCEKLMFARRSQLTPLHWHRKKKEDIICRHGKLAFELWPGPPDPATRGTPLTLNRNGRPFAAQAGESFVIEAGERLTLIPGVCHAFWPGSDECIIGEVSTANDDANDNFFVDPRIGRFPAIEEDEPAVFRLVNDG